MTALATPLLLIDQSVRYRQTHNTLELMINDSFPCLRETGFIQEEHD